MHPAVTPAVYQGLLLAGFWEFNLGCVQDFQPIKLIPHLPHISSFFYRKEKWGPSSSLYKWRLF